MTASTRVPWRRQPSVYPSGNLGRVELNADDAAVLACAASGLRRVQRARQREAVSPADPDQRSLLRLGDGSRVLPGVPGGDGRTGHRSEYLGLRGQLGRAEELRDRLGRAA